MNVASPIIQEREMSQAASTHFEGVFDKQTCTDIIDFCKENLKIEEALAGTNNKSLARKSEIGWIYPSDQTNHIFQKIIEKTNKINQFYNFDIVGITEPIQFTSYNGSGNEHYGWHLDMGAKRQSRRKLSLVIQLSDENDYTGGELQVHSGSDDDEIRAETKKQGSMIFFPSYLRHRVTPVTSGHRYSLVSWLSGQPYK
tara:strand:+ start:1768 stop:2364 length:597 start_codon:yes stop_codon:yes gene_type:complete